MGSTRSLRSVMLAFAALSPSIAVHAQAPVPGQSPVAETPGPGRLTVDLGQVAGRWKPLDGVNGNGGIGDPAGYRAARIGAIRIHDSTAGDVDSVYSLRARLPARPVAAVPAPRVEENGRAMFPNPDADPDDPASYNFGPTDAIVARIRASGAEPLFRLGRSAGAESDVPKDLDRWAKVAAHVVMHYNQGWANGYRYGIRYWEVWNEPDFSSFFMGYPAQYYELYAKVARAVKAADSDALIGGPTQARPYDERPYGEEFLAYVRDNGLPLDFFSWHWYSENNDPYDLMRVGRVVRERLDRYGFTATTSIVDEWNSAVAMPQATGRNTGAHAAFTASALAYMQQGPIDQQFEELFGPRPNTGGPRRPSADLLFGSPRGKDGSVLAAWGSMKDTALRLDVGGTRTDGFTAVAAKSKDEKLVQLFVSNYRIPDVNRAPQPAGALFHHYILEGRFADLRRQERIAPSPAGYTVALTGLKPGVHRVQRYRISDTHDLDLVETTNLRGTSVTLRSDLSHGGVELIKVTNVR